MSQYMAVILSGAGRGPERAKGALMAALRAGESLDMAAIEGRSDYKVSKWKARRRGRSEGT